MVDLIAKKAFTYARRALRVGDRFAAHDGDVRLLLAIGQAAQPDAPAVPAPAPAPPPVLPPVERPPADPDPTGHGDEEDDDRDAVPDEEPDPVEATTRAAAATIRRRLPTRRKPVGR